MNQTQIGSFEHIPLAAIRPSTTNPRKHFDPAALEELTNSVRELGVTVPIHVRTLHDQDDGEVLGYEIVTGERRFRAAIAAELLQIPAIVHEDMEDEDAMDLQLVENLQRADLHPVEEAEGYRALMAHGETAEDVAKKAGKTLGYVQQRLKLLSLEVDAKKLFADGHLTLGHALHLARLTPKDQERAMRFLLELNGDYQRMAFVDALKQRSSNHAKYYPERRLVDKTEAQLKEWISSNVLLQLKGVPWDLGDAELLPIAGACTTCPKRTGANAALFQDLTTAEDTCTDPACFADKQKAFTRRAQELAKEQGSPLLKISAKHSTERLEKPAVEIRASAVKLQAGKAVETERAVVVATKPVKEGQWVPSKKGACPATVQAIATDGPDQGKLRYVCADQACKVHHHAVLPTRAMTHGVGGVNFAERNKLEQAKREREEKIEKATREAVFAELMKSDAQHRNAIARLIEFCVRHVDGMAVDLPELCVELGIKVPGFKAGEANWGKLQEAVKKAEPLFRKYLDEATVPELHDVALTILALQAKESYDEDDVECVARMFGVDADAIEETVRAKFEADEKAAAAAAPAVPAKKAAKKKGGK